MTALEGCRGTVPIYPRDPEVRHDEVSQSVVERWVARFIDEEMVLDVDRLLHPAYPFLCLSCGQGQVSAFTAS